MSVFIFNTANVLGVETRQRTRIFLHDRYITTANNICFFERGDAKIARHWENNAENTVGS